MNDYSSIQNNTGLLKQSYDPSDETLDALRRRQERMAQKVKNQSAIQTPPKQGE